MKTPLISVGIPTYNRCGFVIRAIESILAQTYTNIEVIISDNASTDDTPARIRSISDPRITYIRQLENHGLTNNFNACLNGATGDLFLMLSDDDLLEPTCIEKLSEPFRSEDPCDAEVGITWCLANVLDPTGKIMYSTEGGPRKEFGWELVEGLFRGTRGPRFCGILFRRKDGLAVGGYHASHEPICDVGTWALVAASRPYAVCIPERLVGYTVHQASTSSQAQGAKWQRSGEQITRDLVALLDKRGDHAAARRIKAAGDDNTSNLLATVMMQYMGKPGWVKYWISEAVRAPKYLFAPVVFKRLFKDGWKLLRLRSSN